MLKKVLAGLVGVCIIYGLMIFSAGNDKERGFISLDVAKDQLVVKTLDIKEYGVLKYYLNPNVVTVYVKIKDKSKVPRAISYEFSGMAGYISQGSKKGIWRPVVAQEVLQKNKQGDVSLSLELSFPREKIKTYELAQGSLLIYADQKQVSEVQIKLLNSANKLGRSF